MYPVNQVILGGGDSTFNPMNDIDSQMQMLETYKAKLLHLRDSLRGNIQSQTSKLIWDEIDEELNPMSDELKSRLFQDEEYSDTYNKILSLVLAEILNLVKGRIESTQEGKQLLENQLKIVKKLKGKIIDDTNKEMELFRKFKAFSKNNPGVTYEEFLKSNI